MTDMTTGLPTEQGTLIIADGVATLQPAPAKPTLEELQQALRSYCEDRKALKKLSNHADKVLNRGLTLLAAAYLLMFAGTPGLLILPLGLAGTWLLCKSVGQDEEIAALQYRASQQHQTMTEMLEYAEAEHRDAAINASIQTTSYRRWLTSHLTGPIEIGRQPT